MSIRMFHLTYDADSVKYPNAMEDVIEVLCNKCYVTEIGHPVESTFIFKMTSSDYDFEKVREVLTTRFPNGFWFVISRVAYLKKSDTESNIEHFTLKPCKEHTTSFPDLLKKLRDAKKISTAVKNLSV